VTVFALGTFAVAAASIGDWGVWRQIAVAAVGSVLITAANPPKGLTIRRRRKPASPSQRAPGPPSVTVGLLSRLTKVAAQVLVISAALAVLGYAFATAYSFAAGVVKRPPGVDDAALLSAVDSQLRQCAKAAVLEPIHCPQDYDLSPGSAEAVRWSLYGQPTDGATVEWDGLDKVFDVYGTAVMTVHYVTGDDQELEIVPFGYHFMLEWTDNKPSIKSVAGTGGDLNLSTVRRKVDDKPRPTLPEAEFRDAVRRAFEWCASSTVASPPPECPARHFAYDVEDQRDFRWSLPADPLLNSAVGFDDEFGLVKISGDYVLRVDYTDQSDDREHVEYAGRYAATLIVHDGKPTVLKIEEL
jgi:hypothetical protein